MDLKQIDYFLELARQEHVSATADFFRISQPALSKSIASLEKELGVRLFDRYGNHIRLNEAGRQFVEYARRSRELLQSGFLAARESMYEMQGSVRISCLTFSGILTPCALEYQRLNPRVKLILEQSYMDTMEEGILGRNDFLLCAVSGENDHFLKNDQSWAARPLFSEEMYLVISPRYREYPDSIDSLSMKELRDEWFVTIPQRTLFFSDITYQLCYQAEFAPKVAWQTNDFLTKITIVGEGRAVCVLPECCLEQAKRMYPDLRSFRIQNAKTERTICLLRKRRLLLSETALDFWDFVLDYFGQEPDSEIQPERE